MRISDWSSDVCSSDLALFLVDARAGLVPLDEEIARWLRGSTTPIVLVANKAEGRAGEAGVYEAMALGLGDPVQLSAEHGEGMGELFEGRSEDHKPKSQSLMRNAYDVFCVNKKT